MASVGVKKQWTKFLVLQTTLPMKILTEVKPILRKSEADFTDNKPYKALKKEIMRIFGPRIETGAERALRRTLTGKQSQLAREIIDDISPMEWRTTASQEWSLQSGRNLFQQPSKRPSRAESSTPPTWTPSWSWQTRSSTPAGHQERHWRPSTRQRSSLVQTELRVRCHPLNRLQIRNRGGTCSTGSSPSEADAEALQRKPGRQRDPTPEHGWPRRRSQWTLRQRSFHERISQIQGS